MIYTVTLNPAVDRELTVPAIEFDTVLRAAQWRVDCGGKGFNVSRMLQSLGTSSVALAFAGGYAGKMLRDSLHSLDIATDFVPIPGETRTNVSIVSHEQDRYIKVNEPGPTVPEPAVATLRAKIAELAQPGDWWVLAGSLPPGVPSTVYADIINILQEAGAHAVLDSSGEALAHGCAAGPFLIKPNDAEMHTLTGVSVETPKDVADAARIVRERGVTNVVVSLGKKGALLVDEQNALLATPPSIVGRNPIGAGDSMVGGLVWALSQGRPIAQALRWGIACGAATASMDGTAVGPRDLVVELVGQVEVRPLVLA